MNTFFNSPHCLSGVHCRTCRSNRKWREGMMGVFSDIHEVDYECKWGGRPPIHRLRKYRHIPARLATMCLESLAEEMKKHDIDEEGTELLDNYAKDDPRHNDEYADRMRIWIAEKESLKADQLPSKMVLTYNGKGYEISTKLQFAGAGDLAEAMKKLPLNKWGESLLQRYEKAEWKSRCPGCEEAAHTNQMRLWLTINTPS